MTEQNMDHAQVMVPPPLVFLGYLIGALILNWIVPFPAPWTFILRLVGGLAIIGGILFVGSAFLQMRKANTPVDPREPVTRIRDQWPLSLHAQSDLSRILFDLSWIYTFGRYALGFDRLAVSDLDDHASSHPRRGNLSR